MKRILVDLRPDLHLLAKALSREFELVQFKPTARTQPPDPPLGIYHWNLLSPGGHHIEIEGGPLIRSLYSSVEWVVRETDKIQDLAGCLLWNTVLPYHAAVALLMREKGIPVFEPCHWAISTYLQGHFEDVSLADHVLCSEEHKAFAEWSGSPSKYHAIGRVQYDDWEVRDAVTLRKKYGLPVNGPYILKTSTWTHGLSAWSDVGYHQAHEWAMTQALVELKGIFPNLVVLWTIRGGEDLAAKAKELREMKMEDILLTNDTPIKDLVDMSDLVLSQKSGVAVDAVVSERPAVTVDFKPQVDSWRWKPGCISLVRSPQGIATEVERLLGPGRQAMIEAQRKERVWYGRTGNAVERAVELIRERCS